MKTQAELEIIAHNKKFHEVQRKCMWWMGIVIIGSFLTAIIIGPFAILVILVSVIIVFIICSSYCRIKGVKPCKPKKYLAPKKQSKIEALYENNLKPKLEILEKQRKIIHSKLTFWKRVFFWLTIGIWAALFTSIINSLHGDGRIIAIIFLFVIPFALSIVIYSIISRKIIKPYRKKFKAEIIDAIVATVDESLTYYPQKNISFRDFMASGLFYAERVDGEDYVEGMLGNTAARFSEIRATYTVETGEGTENKVSFTGLFFVFDFNKTFEGRTVVVPQYSGNNNYGQIVRLESPEFEKMFAVYSDDQITARYVLSLSLMQRILSFSLQHRAIYLSFVNGILYVGIPGGSSSVVMGKVILPFFEPIVSSTLLNFELYRKEFIYLSFIKDIVEEFNLNRRIWSKRVPLPILSQDNLKKMINSV
ncbi:DUF3137 domain-containing protein [Candidatus Parabeggiatoa sp. HSG14]|uniref:DUF3137 domain-containing protein n=1 Tax=Candidatus Parabeggiatoa sp. HSG14 TaxID=3055593 RepID=UPI0025A87EAA|nr:DUF3137 domain-containing protein [Thiotrichales bacterium HSG14]